MVFKFDRSGLIGLSVELLGIIVRKFDISFQRQCGTALVQCDKRHTDILGLLVVIARYPADSLVADSTVLGGL